MTRERAAAVEAGEAGYRRLRRDLDDYGTRLDAVRIRLVPRSDSRRLGASGDDGAAGFGDASDPPE